MTHDLMWFWNELAACEGNLPKVLDVIARRAAETVGEASVIALVSDDGQMIEPVAVHHPDREINDFLQHVFSGGPLPIRDTVAGLVATERAAVTLADVDPEAMATMSSGSARPFLEQHPIHSLLIVPMVAADDVVGTLSVVRISSTSSYSDADRLMLDALAEQAALAVRDTRHVPVMLGSPEYEALFHHSLDGVLLTVPDGRILAANPAACELLGRSEAQICRLGRRGVVVDDDRLARMLALRSATGRARGELTFRRGDDQTFIAEASSAVFWTDEGLRSVISFRDITAQVAHRQQLEDHRAELEGLVERDELTGLLNRRGFQAASEAMLAFADREGATVQVIFFDLDDFKGINDQFGHLAGDLALKRTGAAIAGAVRDVDVAARLAGDEFVTLLFDTSEDDTHLVVDRIAKDLEGQGPDGQDLTLSAGLATRPCGSTIPFHELLDLADHRMYQQKVLHSMAAHRQAGGTPD